MELIDHEMALASVTWELNATVVMETYGAEACNTFSFIASRYMYM